MNKNKKSEYQKELEARFREENINAKKEAKEWERKYKEEHKEELEQIKREQREKELRAFRRHYLPNYIIRKIFKL